MLQKGVPFVGAPIQPSLRPSNLMALSPKRLAQDQRAVPDPYEQTIGFGAVVGIVGRNQAPGARHVFDNDGGIAGNMLAHVPPEGARREIIASARGKPHYKADGFAFVKLVGGCRSNSKRKQRDSDHASY